jgi:hypothetical protein
MPKWLKGCGVGIIGGGRPARKVKLMLIVGILAGWALGCGSAAYTCKYCTCAEDGRTTSGMYATCTCEEID